MYVGERVLRADGHRHSLGIRWVSVLRVFVPAIGLPSRLLHNQRLSFSYLEIEERGESVGGR